MNPNNFTYGHLVKIEWLVTDETAAGSPDRAERAILFGDDFGLALFLPIQAVFVVGEPLHGA